MADPTYYAAKIAECLRMLEKSDDPLSRDVYRAMADEFAAKCAALSGGEAEPPALAGPPAPLLGRVAPPPPAARQPGTRSRAADARPVARNKDVGGPAMVEPRR